MGYVLKELLCLKECGYFLLLLLLLLLFFILNFSTCGYLIFVGNQIMLSHRSMWVHDRINFPPTVLQRYHENAFEIPTLN